MPVPQKIDAALTEQCEARTEPPQTNNDLLTVITQISDCNKDLNSRMKAIREMQPE